MEAINITAYPQDISQAKALKAVLKALKIKFEINNTEDTIYNPRFVAKIKKSQEEYKEGNFITVEKENFKSFLGIE